MTIIRTTYPERILIVLNPDGTLKGAHQEAIESIRDGETVVVTRQLAATPLDAVTLATVLPASTSLLAQVATLTDQVTALTAERDAAVTDKTLAEAQVQALRDQIAGSATVDANGVPQRVSPYQARQALHAAGLLDDIEAAVALADKPVQIAWEYALTVERQSALIAAMTPALGLTDQQVDDLFRAAAQVV